MTKGTRFEEAPPLPEDFVRLRAECGWGEISLEAAKNALSRSVIDLSCFDGGDLVGMGRVVGDGVLYFYLQDIIVKRLRLEYRQILTYKDGDIGIT